MPKRLWQILSIMIVLAVPALCRAADVLTVHAASGRTFAGQVDPRTDEQTLWLRAGKPKAFVVRPIEWRSVVSIEAKGQQHTADEFRRLIAQPDWQWADQVPARGLPKNSVAPSEPVEVNPQPHETATAEIQFSSEPPAIGPVRTLHIDAFAGRWQAGTETSGVVLHVQPLDDWGQLVPVLGTLTVELIGQGYTNGVSGQAFPQLGRWSFVLDPHEFGPNGAVVRLPFQALHPDFRRGTRVNPFGLVHAQLSVAGEGVFAASADFVRIRPYSPLRDGLEQYQPHRRFFAAERTLRSPLGR
jgi:hypothetical protein